MAGILPYIFGEQNEVLCHEQMSGCRAKDLVWESGNYLFIVVYNICLYHLFIVIYNIYLLYYLNITADAVTCAVMSFIISALV